MYFCNTISGLILVPLQSQQTQNINLLSEYFYHPFVFLTGRFHAKDPKITC